MTKARDLANAGTALTTVSATELGYLDGVTSAVQTQINSKIAQATAINPTIVDAKGDIVAATAADTVARLAVGANNTVLTADSAEATGLKWATPAAGGFTQIASVTLSGTTTTISSIPNTYKQYYLVLRNITASTGHNLTITPLRSDNAGDNEIYHLGNYSITGGTSTAFAARGNIPLVPTSSVESGATVNQFAVTFFGFPNQYWTYEATSAYFSPSSQRIAANQTGFFSLSGEATKLQFSGGTFTGGVATLFGAN